MDKVFIVREKVEYTDNYEAENNRDEIIGVFTNEQAAVAFMQGAFAGCRDTVVGNGRECDFDSTDDHFSELTAYDNGEVSEEWEWKVEGHEVME